jgi:hypothetical protein
MAICDIKTTVCRSSIGGADYLEVAYSSINSGWHRLQHLFLHINISARFTVRLHYYTKGSRLVAMRPLLEYK